MLNGRPQGTLSGYARLADSRERGLDKTLRATVSKFTACWKCVAMVE